MTRGPREGSEDGRAPVTRRVLCRSLERWRPESCWRRRTWRPLGLSPGICSQRLCPGDGGTRRA